METAETRKRLPVMAQIAWFRLKYPEGRFSLSVTAAKDCFVATARVYKDCMDPPECFLSEATASRGYLPEKPTVSPREWAQTAALGIALRNAGFGLQFHAAGESFDEPAADEFGNIESPPSAIETETDVTASAPTGEPGEADISVQTESRIEERSEEDPFESAKKMPCPIGKYRGKTLGDMISVDPNALVWIANKFTGEAAVSAAAKLICEHALAATA
jgi:hypothetical protein